MKTCTKCGNEYPLDYFDNDNRAKSKKSPHCKGCRSKKAKQLYKDNPVPLNYGQHRRSNLKKLYGITVEEYDALFEKQGGVCAICGEPETLVKRGQLYRLAVDHDHETGAVRGLLCSSCNRGLGLFKDNPDVIARALEYLR